MASQWYEDFFHGIANELWAKCVTPEQTRSEADFLADTLAVKPGSKLLDLPCGNGRHCLELAARGFQMTGMDLSTEFLRDARAGAKATGRDGIEWVEGDMRRVDGPARFDGAFCFGNSFGYLEYADMETYLAGLGRAVKAGARFVLQTGIAAESILPSYKERSWMQVADILFLIENRYRPETSCLESTLTFVREGKTETREARHHVYSVAELGRMLGRAGFKVSGLFGTLDRKPFKLGDPYLYLVAEKGA
jgi:SAM-dependent methyltransferase